MYLAMTYMVHQNHRTSFAAPQSRDKMVQTLGDMRRNWTTTKWAYRANSGLIVVVQNLGSLAEMANQAFS